MNSCEFVECKQTNYNLDTSDKTLLKKQFLECSNLQNVNTADKNPLNACNAFRNNFMFAFPAIVPLQWLADMMAAIVSRDVS